MERLSINAAFDRKQLVGGILFFFLSSSANLANAEDIQFNIDLLDVKDRQQIDLNRFSHGAYIMPGEYVFAVHVNKQELSEQTLNIYPDPDSKDDSQVCITPQLVSQFGLKTGVEKQLRWWHDANCLEISSLPGLTLAPSLATSALVIGVPATWLEYASEYWDPPSTWDEGIFGALLDYNVNLQQLFQQKGGNQRNESANGVVGVNVGPWRLRADWQARNDTGSGASQRSWDWSRYYAYRALPHLAAKLTLGEDFLTSDIFDSFRFAGISLVTDDNMLPANLRGYAPEVSGIANTNAKVVISQQGRVLKEVLVPAGAFRIQDISDSVSGKLDVRIEEQDGTSHSFQMDTASVPYLTRPGMVRYKTAVGRPMDANHRTQGPAFATGEFSWGVNNGWSLYGGGVIDENYQAAALGIGRDLLLFGALAFDVTQSKAMLSDEDGTLTGRSYRLSYSKRFDDFDNQVTFAGYRFSEKNYMSMSEYLDARNWGRRSQSSKEMYTVTFNQQLREWGTSVYLNYNHQSYWDSPANDSYNLTASKYLDLWRMRNISLSLTLSHSKYDGRTEDGMYLSLSVPVGQQSSVSYSGTYAGQESSHQLNYNSSDSDGNFYQIGSGLSRQGVIGNGYYSYRGSMAQWNGSASYQEGSYSSLGMSVQGGVTVTPKGAALHRAGSPGSTRMLVDTDGNAGIPIKTWGSPTWTNVFGKAVVSDISSYSRSRVSIDLNAIPDDAQAMTSVVQATLTEGAIGYRHFSVIGGAKNMAIIRLADGSTPPFGATVLNPKNQEVGIVGDDGSVWLSGIVAGETMQVNWLGKAQCELQLPESASLITSSSLLLPCRSLNRVVVNSLAKK
ncbi:outer membrane usher protein [Enterobacter sp. CC120223-11]|uniref:outer membrane usher protein n=1 Tax=Enterobacter sp. CC120223-11 TaxID=1378073 RepID=UPI000BCC38B6|nr:outer membrane usher protein [Enterobacter sp. CC120223-11]SNY75330.1 Outer membrane usher protein FimD/PapC [Enterobacter sp. CC120223-11]